MTKSTTTSLRERLREPAAEALVKAYYEPLMKLSLKYLFSNEMRIHFAHGLMLVRQKIVSSDDMRRIFETLLHLYDSGPKVLEIEYSQEDLYFYVERYLIQRLGPEIGGRLHTARSRNDLHTTSWRMALRASLLDLIEVLNSLRATVLSITSQHTETVMPGYTHSQHAQPITLGYYLLTVADLLRRDFVRLQAALKQTDRCPLGSGALSTSGFPIDRHFTAELLGFTELVEVAYDGVSCRDDLHEATAALSILMTNLSRLAFDLQSWSTLEFGFIELGDAYSSVSSIMPQKKNPKAIEHTKAAAAEVIGSFFTTLSCSKNTSLSDVYDGVSAINAPALDAVERTKLVLLLLDGVVKTMKVRAEKMLHSARAGFGTATEIADVIVRESGLSFRMAHNIVGRTVREVLKAGKVATDITPEDLDRASRALFSKPLRIQSKTLQEVLDPVRNVGVRTVVGGPNPEIVRSMIARRETELKKDCDSIAAANAGVSEAFDRLVQEVRRFVA